MSCPTTSLVPVPKSLVEKAALRLKERAKWEKVQEREREIEKALTTRKIKIGWLKKRPITRTEAEHLVDEGYLEELYINEFGFLKDKGFCGEWKHAGRSWYIPANRFLSACHVITSSESSLWLNLEDASLVDRYQNWETPED